MSQIILDPIYGTIEVETWAQDLLASQQLATERTRLERIKNLGLIHISFPSATHSKWEHHLGMFHLAKQLQLPAEDKKRLKILCLLGGIGHLPFTFPTEQAVLLATKLSTTFKRSLAIKLGEVSKMCLQVSSEEFRRRLPNLVDDIGREELHSWFTALKFKQLARTIDLGDRTELVYERLNVQGSLNELYRFLSRLDYVQRDLYYTGLAKFSLPAEGFLRRHKPSIKELSASPESLLLEELRSYLAGSLYFEPRSISREALYEKRFARMLAGGEITIDQLLAWNDGELESGIVRHGGGAWWTQLTREEFTRICSLKMLQRRVPSRRATKILNTESQILGKRNINPGFLVDYPMSEKVIVVPRFSSDPREGRSSVDVFISAIGDPGNCRFIASAVWNLANIRFGSRLAWYAGWTKLGQEFLSYLLNAAVRADYGSIAEIFAIGFASLPTKKQRQFIRKLDKSSNDIFYYPIVPTNADFWEETLKGPLFAAFLGEEVKTVAELLRLAARTGKKDFAQIVEGVIWTHEQHDLRSVEAKWVLPNVTIEGKNGVNQVDAVSLSIQGRKVILRFHECSKSDSEGKAFDDFQKLEKIRAGAKAFKDLDIQRIVHGASGLQEHFSPLQSLLDRYRIKAK